MDALLKLLSENARFSAEELATFLELSPEEVRAHVARLEKDGVIRGYTALINWEKVDAGRVTALIELRVTPQPDAGFEQIAEHIMRLPQVESVYLMSGGYDLCVTVCGESFRDVAMFVAKRLATVRGVLSTATHFVLRRYKDMGVELCDPLADDRGTVSL